MKLEIIIDGKPTFVDTNPGDFLRDVIQKALDQTKTAGKPEDYICMSQNWHLDLKFKLNEQKIKYFNDQKTAIPLNIEGYSLYAIHKSRSSQIISPVNPYR